MSKRSKKSAPNPAYGGIDTSKFHYAVYRGEEVIHRKLRSEKEAVIRAGELNARLTSDELIKGGGCHAYLVAPDGSRQIIQVRR